MHRLPAKVSYGIMAAIELAKQDDSSPLQARVIAKRQGIPSRFIEQILQLLKQAGLVRSIRGPQGGYTLALHPRHISLADLVNSLNGSESGLPVHKWSAHSHPEGADVLNALFSEIWQQVQEAEQAVLRVITLETLVEQYKKLETQQVVMYHI